MNGSMVLGLLQHTVLGGLTAHPQRVAVVRTIHPNLLAARVTRPPAPLATPQRPQQLWAA